MSTTVIHGVVHKVVERHGYKTHHVDDFCV